MSKGIATETLLLLFIIGAIASAVAVSPYSSDVAQFIKPPTKVLPVNSCSDSDGGINTGIKGTVEAHDFNDARQTTYVDNCRDYTLTEYYCDGIEPAWRTYTCGLGCGDGVCLAVASCGDGFCNGDETCSSCPQDCDACPACGNGIVEGTEECDDGNTNDGDGCSSDCMVEQENNLYITGIRMTDIYVDGSGEILGMISNYGTITVEQGIRLHPEIQIDESWTGAGDFNRYILKSPSNDILCNYTLYGSGPLGPSIRSCVRNQSSIPITNPYLDYGFFVNEFGTYYGVYCNTTDSCVNIEFTLTGEEIIPPICGNSIIETGEECDGNDFGGLTCQDFGYDGGDLLCHNCTIGVVGTINCWRNETTCIDTDGGSDFFTSGTASGIFGATNEYVVKHDTCSEDGYHLSEYYCVSDGYYGEGPYVDGVYRTCYGGCVDGACIWTDQCPLTDVSSDYPTGDDPYVKGASPVPGEEDSCQDNNTLRERFCHDSLNAQTIIYCENGCSDGACVVQTGPSKVNPVYLNPGENYVLTPYTYDITVNHALLDTNAVRIEVYDCNIFPYCRGVAPNDYILTTTTEFWIYVTSTTQWIGDYQSTTPPSEGIFTRITNFFKSLIGITGNFLRIV